MTRVIESCVRRPMIALVLGIVCSALSGCWGVPTSNPDSRCVPPSYPEMQLTAWRSGYIYLVEASDSLETIQAEYSAELQPAPWQGPFGDKLWRLKEFDGSFLYECVFGSDGYEIEVGCVFIREDQDRTIIQLVWEIGEGGGSCASILGITDGG